MSDFAHGVVPHGAGVFGRAKRCIRNLGKRGSLGKGEIGLDCVRSSRPDSGCSILDVMDWVWILYRVLLIAYGAGIGFELGLFCTRRGRFVEASRQM